MISRFIHLKSRTPRLSDFVLIFGTPLLLSQVMPSADNWITSPSPDTATAALLLVTFAYSFDAFKSNTLSDYSSALILCAMSLTFRPLAIFISAFVILVFFAAIVRKRVSFLQSLPGFTLSASHKLSTIQHADIIIYIENGIIKGSGSLTEVQALLPDFDKHV